MGIIDRLFADDYDLNQYEDAARALESEEASWDE